MRAVSKYLQIKILSRITIGLILTSIMLNLLLLFDGKLITYFKLVNVLTGSTLIATVLLTWLAKKLLNKQKTDYVHKVFSKN
jgi:hypothetical protein